MIFSESRNFLNGFLFLFLISASFRALALPDITKILTESGWDEAAASAVEALNRDWFIETAKVSPHDFERQLAQLVRLGKYSQTTFVIKQHPEIAALLAGSEKPSLLAKTLFDEECYPYITQQYSLQATPNEALGLATVLDEHGAVICELAQRGIPTASILFIYPHETSAGHEYTRWLEEEIRASLKRIDEEADDHLSDLTTFIALKGGDIRRRMDRDENFRNQFRKTLWPRLMRTVHNERFSLAITEPHIWDVLALPDGEAFVRDWGPFAPAALLFGENAYPKSLHDTVQELLRNADTATVSTLVRFAGEPTMEAFLARNLSWDMKAKIITLRAASCPEDTEVFCQSFVDAIKKDIAVTTQGLQDELKGPPTGPKTWIPFYTTYYTLRKASQGREVDTLEVAFLFFDIATIAIPVAKVAGSAAKSAVQATVKSAANKAITEVGETVATQQLKILSREALAKKLGGEFSKRLTENQLVPQALKSTLKTYIPLLSKARAYTHKLVSFDVTKPTQFLFDKAGVGRETFKTVTGLEARVFMRNDARVVIYPSTGLLQKTAEKAAEDQLRESSVSYVAWQKNASGWWLLNSAN